MARSRSHLVPVCLAAVLLLAGAANPRHALLPDETPIALPAGAGAELAASHCAACHSLDYITTQPRGKGAQFWKDSVAKMVNLYGAPIDRSEADKIATYLAEIFGKALK